LGSTAGEELVRSSDEDAGMAEVTPCWSGFGSTVTAGFARSVDEDPRAAGVTVVLALLLIARIVTATVKPAIAMTATASSARRCW
jgi:hypothetical protein